MPAELDELAWHRAGPASYGGRDIARQQREAADHIRLFRRLIDRTEQLEYRVAAEQVIHSAALVARHHQTSGRRAHLPVVSIHLLGEGSRLPTLHPGSDHRDVV